MQIRVFHIPIDSTGGMLSELNCFLSNIGNAILEQNPPKTLSFPILQLASLIARVLQIFDISAVNGEALTK